MSKWKEFWLNKILVTIWDVKFYHKDYQEEGLEEHRYFLFKRAAYHFAEQVKNSKNYIVADISCVILWLVRHKFEFPED